MVPFKFTGFNCHFFGLLFLIMYTMLDNFHKFLNKISEIGRESKTQLFFSLQCRKNNFLDQIFSIGFQSNTASSIKHPSNNTTLASVSHRQNLRRFKLFKRSSDISLRCIYRLIKNQHFRANFCIYFLHVYIYCKNFGIS